LLVVPPVTMAGNYVNESAASLASSHTQYGIDTSKFAPVFHTNDPFIDNQWALSQMPTFSELVPENEVLVAVLDTGIDTSHEDLKGSVAESIILSSSKTLEDIQGHGTHIAGIITATRNNKLGIAGVASNIKLLNVKVAEDNGMVWASKAAQGIIWATDKGAKVINMSLTVPSKLQVLEDAVHYASSRGVVLVAAAGNSGNNASTYPGAYDEVIAVAATTAKGEVWAESTDGPFVSAYAPGFSILSTLPSNKYGYLSGSSMASAYVSAIAAELINRTADANNDGKINDEIAYTIKTLFHKPAR
jgi:thermitase